MDRQQCLIRKAQAKEAALLSALAFRSKAHWGYSPAFMTACRAELSYHADQIESAQWQFAILQIDNTVIGFYALKQSSVSDIELEALFVEPEHIGKGYGRALIEHAKQSATQWGARALTIQSDPHAEAFYQAAGGKRIGQSPSGSIAGRYLPVLEIVLHSA